MLIRKLAPAFAIAFLLAGGCAVPELEQRELKITMARSGNETNSTAPARMPGVTAQDSLFRQYDEKMSSAIQKRWHELTPQIQMRGLGQVVVDFKLNPEGGVTDVQVRPTRLLGFAVDICRQAILESAPFDPWPAEMRNLIGQPERQVTFTFNYR